MKNKMFTLFEKYIEGMNRTGEMLEKFFSGEWGEPEELDPVETVKATCPHCWTTYNLGHLNFSALVCKHCGKEFRVVK